MAPLYSRYVPPKEGQLEQTGLPDRTNSVAQQEEQQKTNVDESNGRKKRKRNDAEDSDRKAPKHARSRSEGSGAAGDGALIDVPAKDSKREKKRERKAGDAVKSTKKDKAPKKEQNEGHEVVKEASAEAGDGDDDDDDDDDEDEDEDSKPAKHNSVFSKFQKAAERSAHIQATAGPEGDDDKDEPHPELHDLTPLPQQRREATPEYVPTFSALPDWLAHPIVVSQSTTKPFSELSLSSKTVAQLESKGWTNAFAVQSALLPLLLPHPYLTHLPPNDICVSAPTGSGKTLGYVLPIIESLRTRTETRLRAVIVVPTRELVQQAQDVASACAAGTGLRVAIAVGNQNLAVEQESLIKKGRRYDPDGYRKLMAKAKKRIRHEDDSEDENDSAEPNKTAAAAAKNAMLADVVDVLPDHVPIYTSAVDVLICTPGRLVEHMNSTVGFNLDHVEWLVIDEADRLLDQSFQEWVAKVVGALEITKPDPRREMLDRALPFSLQRKERYVRKVILSATMTRDIAKLSALRLRRPSLIQVKGGAEDDEDKTDNVQSSVVNGAEVYELPRTLTEHAVPVGDGLDKPLYLLELLRTRILSTEKQSTKPVSSSNKDLSSDSDSSDSDSDSSSDSSSDTDSDSDSDSDSSSDSSSSDSDSDSDSSSTSSSSSSSSSKPSSKSSPSKPTTPPMVLIFTGSTEEANRLHHVLTHLSPSYAPLTTLLTKATQNPTHQIHKHITTTTTTPSTPSIIISTDRASRGLDLPRLTHVVNYHMPRSVSTYVHRVGRTARAGRGGEAWTLFQETQGRWFWREVARGNGAGKAGMVGTGERISRKGEVERVNLRLGEEWSEGGVGREGYLGLLGEMRDMVGKGQGGKGKGKKGDVHMTG